MDLCQNKLINLKEFYKIIRFERFLQNLANIEDAFDLH